MASLNFPADTEIVRHIFKKMDIGIRRILSKDDDNPISAELTRNPMVRNTARLNAYYDYFLKGLVVDLTAWLVRSNEKHSTISKDMVIKVPLNWWEMLKRDHLPRWFVRRYPVKTKDVTEKFFFEQEVRVCPHANVVWEDPRHIEFLEFKVNYPVYEEKSPFGVNKGPVGVKCPRCGIGVDTNGDGDCMYCGPRNVTDRRHLEKSPNGDMGRKA
jgi:hypothetical protein